MIAEIAARIALPMPLFWKKLQKRSAATSAIFTTLTVTVSSLVSPANHLSAWLPTVLGYAAAFFGAVAATCALAVDDPAALPVTEPAAEPASPGNN